MPVVGKGPSVVARHARDHLDLRRRQRMEIPVCDEIIGVLVVAPRVDQVADIMKKRAILQPLPLAFPQSVQGLGLVEQLQSQRRNMVGMFFGILTLPFPAAGSAAFRASLSRS